MPVAVWRWCSPCRTCRPRRRATTGWGRMPTPPSRPRWPRERARAASMSLLKSTATITAWNAVSRLTGFVRVLAVGAALGTTFLGNTYQSSNLVSNIMFELLAAGLLAAPLVTLSAVGLGVVALVGMVAGPVIMRELTADVHGAGVRAAEVRLGAFWLWFFLPQMVLYAVGAIASA